MKLAAVLLLAMQLGDFRRAGIATAERASTTAPHTPTLIAMSEFPPQTRPRARSFFRTPGYDDAVLLAVTGTRRARVPIARDFARLWRRAPPRQRVFIAFARRDLASANRIRRALERRGYHCLIFLPHSARTGPIELAGYLRQSPNRFVLDSKNARAPDGVRIESQAARKPSCCRRCYYVNDLLAACDATTCGAHCAKARGS
ncbi:MAG TPA: hypothetical protein VM733_21230 [Thermoanaerobaculia bacterium]|nr:hypothetical protein [Thermoanaerobaculia bacterium]